MSGWTRRELAAAVGAVAVAGCGSDDAPSVPAPVPRGLVFLSADDLGWRDLSAYGLQAVATPHLDRLVAEGVAFDRAFDVVSTCSSSRASLATGQYPHTHGVTALTHRQPDVSLAADTPVLARSLADAGLRTGLQGKWHLTFYDPPEAFGYAEHLPVDLDQRIRDITPALDFLDRVGDDRFFLELNFMQTHRDLLDRFVQVEGYEVDVDAASPPDWWGLPDWPEIREEVAGYLSNLRWMDALIGQVLDRLDALGLGDDTLVVFVSDNGPAFPGCKLTLYDRGVGTPLMFRWPRGLSPRWSSELVGTVQVAPTILELMGADPLPGMQGRSLAPLLRGAPFEPAAAVFSEMEDHIDPHPARAVRTARFKYIRNLTDAPWGRGDGDGAWVDVLAAEPDQTWDEPRVPEELYDLDADPNERVNLADDPAHASVRDELLALLRAHAEATDDPRRTEL